MDAPVPEGADWAKLAPRRGEPERWHPLVDHCNDVAALNDRHSTQACGPSGKSDDVKSAAYAFRSKEWAEAYGTEVHEGGVVGSRSRDSRSRWRRRFGRGGMQHRPANLAL